MIFKHKLFHQILPKFGKVINFWHEPEMDYIHLILYYLIIGLLFQTQCQKIC